MTNIDSARVFVGLKPPEAVCQLIIRYQKYLQETLVNELPSIHLIEGRQPNFVRWTAEDSLHLTLQFIGSVSRQALDSFRWKFRERACQIEPFKVSLGSLGYLPKNRRNMRVVYLGVQDPQKNLDSLASIIRSSVLEQLGLVGDSTVVAVSDSSSSAVSHSGVNQSQGLIHGLDKLTAFSEREGQNTAFYENFHKLKESYPFLKETNSPFLPHITLGRLEKNAKLEERDSLASVISKTSLLNGSFSCSSDNIEWVVKSFIFYESVQEDGRSRYKILEEFHF
ncbi:hypothetical protein GpartN1_g4468.t1 [Galdieria partita]|uniref:Phosphoesterase HXTX domain-containing protein n=1 Tax=Galdieria partita TaxID=83374 RepID=A0A9C7PZD5_9RHOD|nr:hypothetical protein GpartN1_g4468.t1 [Galdieria partita]